MSSPYPTPSVFLTFQSYKLLKLESPQKGYWKCVEQLLLPEILQGSHRRPLVPELVLSEVKEELWIAPSTTSRYPGKSRHHLAWAIFLIMLKYLARVCCYGTDCPGLVSFEKLTAFSLSGVHFDHKDPTVKSNKLLLVFRRIGCKWP